MTEYNVIITPDAENDLNELDNYITFTLQEPDTSVAYLRTLKKQILSLRFNPARHHLLDDEHWHSMGIR